MREVMRSGVQSYQSKIDIVVNGSAIRGHVIVEEARSGSGGLISVDGQGTIIHVNSAPQTTQAVVNLNGLQDHGMVLLRIEGGERGADRAGIGIGVGGTGDVHIGDTEYQGIDVTADLENTIMVSRDLHGA